MVAPVKGRSAAVYALERAVVAGSGLLNYSASIKALAFAMSHLRRSSQAHFDGPPCSPRTARKAIGVNGSILNSVSCSPVWCSVLSCSLAGVVVYAGFRYALLPMSLQRRSDVFVRGRPGQHWSNCCCLLV